MKNQNNLIFSLFFFITLVLLYFFRSYRIFPTDNLLCNPGSLSLKIVFFAIITAILFIQDINTKIFNVASALILGGGFFTILELFVNKCVFDFFNFFGLFVFNYADLSIFLGSILLVYHLFKILSKSLYK